MPSFELSYAPTAFRLLNGVFCVFKDSGQSMKSLRNTLLDKLCTGEYMLTCFEC